MFSQLLFVRLKAAENALRDGRLDEAYRLATATDIREHRRGAAVLVALTDRFIERARVHFRADRFAEALLDLDKAEAGGVKVEEIAELRSNIQTVAREWRRNEAAKCEQVEAARKRIEGGSLAAGRRMLEQHADSNPSVQQLRRAANERAEEAVAMVRLAEDLMAQQQWAAAAQRLHRAKSIDAHHEDVLRAETRLCREVLDSVRSAILAGRIGRAEAELSCLGDAGRHLAARRELEELLDLMGQVGRHLRDHAYGQARHRAMRLARMLPEAEWVQISCDQLRQLDELRTALLAGPLGGPETGEREEAGRRVQVEPGMAPDARRMAAAANPVDETVPLPRRQRPAGTLADRQLLLVDGGGSYLLLSGSSVSLGRAASANPAEVAVFADVAERHATIQRMDDDYFLFSAKDVEVGGRRGQHHLLRDGDRIVLGRRAKFTFRLPSRRSGTAVLDLSDTTKMPLDVRRVVLFDQHATVGAGAGDHIRCQHAGTTLIVFERQGRLWIRRRSDGHVDTQAVEIVLGTPVEIDGACLVVQRWPGPKTS